MCSLPFTGILRKVNVEFVPLIEPMGISLFTCILVDFVLDNAKSLTVSNAMDWLAMVNVNPSIDWDNDVLTRAIDSDVDDLAISIDWDNAEKFELMVLPNCVVVVLIAVAAAFTTLSVYVIVIAALRNWLNRLDGLDEGDSAIYV